MQHTQVSRLKGKATMNTKQKHTQPAAINLPEQEAKDAEANQALTELSYLTDLLFNAYLLRCVRRYPQVRHCTKESVVPLAK